MKYKLTLAIVGCALVACSSYAAMPKDSHDDGQPPAFRESTKQNYFGTEIEDPYRWMEKQENEDKLVNWMSKQGQYTLKQLNNNPYRANLYKRLNELSEKATASWSVRRAGKYTFYMYDDGVSQLPKLMVRDDKGVARALIDPNKLSQDKEKQVAIDNYRVSPDGKYVSYNLSSGGAEITDIYFLETKTGKNLSDVLPWVWGEFSAKWTEDSNGVYYTRMTKESKIDSKFNKLHDMQAYLHRMGTSVDRDIPLLGNNANPKVKFLPEEFPNIIPNTNSSWIVAIGSGAHPENRVFVAKKTALIQAQPKWTSIAEYADAITDVLLDGDTLYYLTTKNTPNGEIRKMSLAKLSLSNYEVVVPQGQAVINNFVINAGSLYYSSNMNGESSLHELSLASKSLKKIELPFVGNVSLTSTFNKTNTLVFSLVGWTQPRTYYEYDSANGRVSDFNIQNTSLADYSGVTVKRVEALSYDNVKVPLTLIYNSKLKLDGKNPTIINGYGGYGVSRNPRFSNNLLAWVEQGGIYAYAHVRGGGEKGEQWHNDGKGVNKKNGVQDFIACTKYLIQNKYSSSSHIAATGGSMGGILIGRAITEHPELFKAANISVGILNALRYLEDQNGANQKSELTATPDNKKGFQILLDMDAYHNIKPGINYPSIILTIGLNDQRVAPWQSAKFAARMQAMNPGTKLLLRTNDSEGHGLGATRDQRILKLAD